MATIQTSIQLKDNMSPALNKIVGRVNNLLQRLNVVQTSGGKIGQSFDKAASSASKITKYVELGNTQVTKMGQLINKNAVSEDKRLSIIGKITNLGKLDEQQKARITTLMNRSETLYRGIDVIQSGLVQKSLKRQQLEAQLVSLKKAEVVDNDKIKKTAADIDAITKRIALDEQKITNAKHARKAIQSQIANMGNADVTIATKRRQLQNQFNSLLGNELHREQQILGIVQQAANAENKKIASQQKAIQFAQQDVRQRLAGIEATKRAQEVADNKAKLAWVEKKAAAQRYWDGILKSATDAHNKTIQNTQKELQAILDASNKKMQLASKVAAFVDSVNNAAWAKNVKRSQAENREAERKIQLESRKVAKAAETAARQNDYLTATRNVTREVEKSFSAQRKVAEQTAKANANQQVSIGLNRQLASEKARLNALTTQLINTQAKINTLERQGKSVSTQMNAAKARKASLLNQIANQQQKILGVERQIKTETNNTANAQNRHNGYLRGAVNDANRLLSTLRNVVSVYAAFNAAKNTLGVADSMTMSRARLGLVNEINGGTDTTDQVQQKVYEAAMRSRGNYKEMSAIIGKMGIRAGESFGSMDEIIGFTETLNKMAAVSGTSVNELNSALLQINQAMGAGRFQGDEFRSVSENLPLALQAVAKYKGVTVGALKDMAKKGEITADVFKNAVMSMAGEIDDRFKKMPVTWEQVWTMCKNHMLKVSDGILKKISAITSSERFVGFMQGLSNIFQKLKAIVEEVFDKMSSGIAYVYDNWDKLKSSIIPVVAALIAYKTAMTAVSIVSAAYAFWQSICAARHMMATGSTLAQAAAQHSLNAAMLACPLTWIIGLLAVVVAVVGSIKLANYDWANSTIDVWGTIKNVFKALAGFLKDVVVKAWEMLKTVALQVWDILQSIAVFVIKNWSYIAPIVWGIVAAFAAYKLVMMGVAVVTAIVTAAKAAWTAICGIAAVVTAVLTGATIAQTLAQWGLNASMYACPYVWIVALIMLVIVAIIALIVIIYLAVAQINEWAGTSISATGIVVGGFYYLYANIYNIFASIWNVIAAFVEFFANVFKHPTYSAKMLFINLALAVVSAMKACSGTIDVIANAIVGAIEWAINQAIDLLNSFISMLPAKAKEFLGISSIGRVSIGKVDFSSAVGEWENKLNAMKGNKPDDYWEAPRMEYKDTLDYAKKGYNKGVAIDRKVSSYADKAKALPDKLRKTFSGLTAHNNGAGGANDDLAKALTGGYDGSNPALDNINKNVGTIAKNTGGSDGGGGVSGDVDYLRELAEREAINRYTLTDLNVNMTNNNSIGSGVDADDVGRRLWRALVNGALSQGQRAIPF